MVSGIAVLLRKLGQPRRSQLRENRIKQLLLTFHCQTSAIHFPNTKCSIFSAVYIYYIEYLLATYFFITLKFITFLKNLQNV